MITYGDANYNLLNTIFLHIQDVLNETLLDRPFCERSILCFAHVSFLFYFSQLTFSDVCKPIFVRNFST